MNLNFIGKWFWFDRKFYLAQVRHKKKQMPVARASYFFYGHYAFASYKFLGSGMSFSPNNLYMFLWSGSGWLQTRMCCRTILLLFFTLYSIVSRWWVDNDSLMEAQQRFSPCWRNLYSIVWRIWYASTEIKRWALALFSFWWKMGLKPRCDFMDRKAPSIRVNMI